eukprot:jgi/Bigna1/89857/estExt_fgenesh1_pg.C_560141
MTTKTICCWVFTATIFLLAGSKTNATTAKDNREHLQALYRWYIRMSTERKACVGILEGLSKAHLRFKSRLIEDMQHYNAMIDAKANRLKVNDTVLICGYPDENLNAKTGRVVSSIGGVVARMMTMTTTATRSGQHNNNNKKKPIEYSQGSRKAWLDNKNFVGDQTAEDL